VLVLLLAMYRSLASLSGSEEAARDELDTFSADQCANLQTAASDLLHTADVTGSTVDTFALHVTDLCDKMKEVGPV